MSFTCRFFFSNLRVFSSSFINRLFWLATGYENVRATISRFHELKGLELLKNLVCPLVCIERAPYYPHNWSQNQPLYHPFQIRLLGRPLVQEGVSVPLLDIPPFFRNMQAHPCPPPLDTHHGKIPDSMMINGDQGDWKQLI